MNLHQIAKAWGCPIAQTACIARFEHRPRIEVRHSAGVVLGFKDQATSRCGGPDALQRMIDPRSASIDAPRRPPSFLGVRR